MQNKGRLAKISYAVGLCHKKWPDKYNHSSGHRQNFGVSGEGCSADAGVGADVHGHAR
jgi:hypothetical protein